MRLIAIVVLVVGVIAGLVYFGVFTKGEVETEARRAVGAVKGAVKDAASFSGEGLNNPAAAKVCRDNLKLIESKKRAIADQRGQAIGVISWDEVIKALGSKPVCPMGGSYSLNSLGQVATCTIGGAGTVASGDNHSISNF